MESFELTCGELLKQSTENQSPWMPGAQGVDIPSKHPGSTHCVPVSAGHWTCKVMVADMMRLTVYGGEAELVEQLYYGTRPVIGEA